MARIFCRVKITGAKVTRTSLEYEGSLGVDKRILEEAGLQPGETVMIANENNGQRFVTYVIPEEGTKEFAVYGAAARLVNVGDRLIIMGFEVREKLSSDEKLPKVIKLS